MKTWVKIAFGISLSFMCVFACVGYGAVLAAKITGNGTRLYKENYDSYNLFYQGYETAPSEDTLRAWPDGKIPLLQ